MNIKLLHHKNNVVSITSCYDSYGIFSKKLLSTEGTYSENYLALKELIVFLFLILEFQVKNTL